MESISQAAEDFEWDTALIEADIRRDYGEERYRTLELIGNKVHALIYTPRDTRRWIIGLRKVNKKGCLLCDETSR